MKINHEIKQYLITIIRLEAYIETIKPEITKIYNEVLSYTIPPEFCKDKRTGEYITDYNQLYRVGDSSYIEAFYKEARTVLIEKGFAGSKFEFCHLLESETLLRDTLSLFVKACIKSLPEKVLQGQSVEQFYEGLMASYFKHYKDFIRINRNYYTQFISKNELKLGV